MDNSKSFGNCWFPIKYKRACFKLLISYLVNMMVCWFCRKLVILELIENSPFIYRWLLNTHLYVVYNWLMFSLVVYFIVIGFKTSNKLQYFFSRLNKEMCLESTAPIWQWIQKKESKSYGTKFNFPNVKILRTRRKKSNSFLKISHNSSTLILSNSIGIGPIHTTTSLG